MSTRSFFRTSLVGAALLACACGPLSSSHDDHDHHHDHETLPTTYSFAREDGSTVSHSGQTMRHVLLLGLKKHIGGLTARIDNDNFVPTAGDIVSELNFFFDYSETDGEGIAHTVLADDDAATPPALQTYYNDLNTKNLKSKLAGNDAKGQHKDWTSDFIGWTVDNAAPTPEALVLHWFERIETLAIDRANGTIGLDPAGAALTSASVTPEGLDLAQLTQKFLLAAVTFSQGADDYLDDDIEGKGLNSSNILTEGKTYTALEHGWDEGFGYFGAAHNYGDYTDDEIAGKGGRDGWSKGYHDTNGDGKIDLIGEMNYGHSINAAKRDRKHSTDMTQDAFDAFVKGRFIIHNAKGELTDDEMKRLKEQRDIAVAAWEKAIAATAIHYINDVMGDMNASEADYNFYNHAKHWSELKGFALSFQFNPRSPLDAAAFQELHAKLGEAPVLPGQAGFDTYKTTLIEARDMLKTAYAFSEDDVTNW